MRNMRPIDLKVAEDLIDFRGRSDAARAFAANQLEGAVALYNMLARHKFAYLADEVGMGKTYVALGTLGLMRHILGSIRVLFIVPRENMQIKWRKEIKNFAANNWRVVDHRVRTFQGTPSSELALCDNLVDFVHKVSINANRDFLLRLTSFSMPLSENRSRWQSHRDRLIRTLPWLDRERFDLRDKSGFKDTLARVINAVMPKFDLVVIDEGHNLKHGFYKWVSTRNRILALSLGHEDENVPLFNGGGRKADRVLVLSATPVESDFIEMWNQMDVLGMGHVARELKDETKNDLEKKEIASRYLIRRITGLEFNGKKHTKNMYRREWRGGGVSAHDDPLTVPGARQRLIVALIQKKVAQLLEKMGRKRGGGFSRSFQIGMLASFESFLQTAKVHSPSEDPGNFDQAEQTDDSAEREGIDTPTVDQFATSYYRRFKEPMPHPKMDAVAKDLWAGMISGEKSLVFVRRVASVREIREKVEKDYDWWLRDYLRGKLGGAPELVKDFDACFDEYLDRKEIEYGRVRKESDNGVLKGSEKPEDAFDRGIADESDVGGVETFFHWFFRGDGPPNRLSGAALRKNRLSSEGSIQSTLFEDNYVAYVLGNGQATMEGIAQALGLQPRVLEGELQQLAFRIFTHRSRQKKFPRLRVYKAYQEAALHLLAKVDSDVGIKAKVVLEEIYDGETEFGGASNVPDSFPQASHYVGLKTFFTELTARPALREALWPERGQGDFRERTRDREQRRELLRAAIVLGHPIIDLWALAVKRIGSMRLREQEQPEERADTLATDLLDLLEEQMGKGGLSSYGELQSIAKRFDLVMDVNFPELRETKLHGLGRYFQATLGHQSPIGGMSGGVNNRLVKQFRMPGYPYVLITTDVLQEGEDLHTFCAKVYHYGISWTPSAMEQRTGRIDRIGSLTHRRLAGQVSVTEDKFLQVYYPYLSETVELVQVHEVFKRINRFLEMMHEAIPRNWRETTTVEVSSQIIKTLDPVFPVKGPLKSSFDVKSEYLVGDETLKPVASEALGAKCLDRFAGFTASLSEFFNIEWAERRQPWERSGKLWIRDGDIVRNGHSESGARHQQFVLSLCTAGGGGHLLLKCTSPIASINLEDYEATFSDILATHRKLGRAKLVADPDSSAGEYTLYAQTNLLFDTRTTQMEEVIQAIRHATTCADEIERRVWGKDVLYDEAVVASNKEEVYA